MSEKYNKTQAEWARQSKIKFCENEVQAGLIHMSDTDIMIILNSGGLSFPDSLDPKLLKSFQGLDARRIMEVGKSRGNKSYVWIKKKAFKAFFFCMQRWAAERGE